MRHSAEGGRMREYPRVAVERAMKVQEVILRAVAKEITWWQAAQHGFHLRDPRTAVDANLVTGVLRSSAPAPRTW